MLPVAKWQKGKPFLFTWQEKIQGRLFSVVSPIAVLKQRFHDIVPT
jgi:hypothetical protein